MRDSQTTDNHRLIAYTALPLMNYVAMPESQLPLEASTQSRTSAVSSVTLFCLALRP